MLRLPLGLPLGTRSVALSPPTRRGGGGNGLSRCSIGWSRRRAVVLLELKLCYTLCLTLVLVVATVIRFCLVRIRGAPLVALLRSDAESMAAQKAAGALANLASDAFDPNSAATKAIARRRRT